MGGWTHCFTILFSYSFSITTIKNPIVTNQKKGSAKPILSFIWGSFSNRKKGLVMISPIMFRFQSSYFMLKTSNPPHLLPCFWPIPSCTRWHLAIGHQRRLQSPLLPTSLGPRPPSVARPARRSQHGATGGGGGWSRAETWCRCAAGAAGGEKLEMAARIPQDLGWFYQSFHQQDPKGTVRKG